MYLKSFENVFPHQADSDRCQLILADNENPTALNGIFDLIDYYCPNPNCNCYKVSIAIIDITPGNIPKIGATIMYGWKSKTFYRKVGFDSQTAECLTQGFLDPEGPQSEHAEEFLGLFSVLIQDLNFVYRLKNRYELFRSKVTSKKRNVEKGKVVQFKAKQRA
ncbi:MAG: hypothetical protein KBD90_04065 [Alphaproteobacteria bacterium]|nr:hypothetical protein [Alphaproteobacteria bacterium]MBP9692490.1 hypothetical protein [Alphaproteobacteria bacterium]